MLPEKCGVYFYCSGLSQSLFSLRKSLSKFRQILGGGRGEDMSVLDANKMERNSKRLTMLLFLSLQTCSNLRGSINPTERLLNGAGILSTELARRNWSQTSWYAFVSSWADPHSLWSSPSSHDSSSPTP